MGQKLEESEEELFNDIDPYKDHTDGVNMQSNLLGEEVNQKPNVVYHCAAYAAEVLSPSYVQLFQQSVGYGLNRQWLYLYSFWKTK